LISLLPRVVDLVGDKDIPVIAAGGIVDARGYVAALALGAQGVCLGTRFGIFQFTRSKFIWVIF
jgi:NAD(P)H-dependent flavin oxidoreductase YrpB (nitropropane dioxygenase family)